MSRRWTRRQILAQAGIAVAAIHTVDPHEICCAMAPDAKYERGMSKYPVGQYRDRVGLKVEMAYLKVVKKS
jgi:hypothetical protein